MNFISKNTITNSLYKKLIILLESCNTATEYEVQHGTTKIVKSAGVAGGNNTVNTLIKDSTDVSINIDSLFGVPEVIRSYLSEVLNPSIDLYHDRFPLSNTLIDDVRIDSVINIQKYEPSQGYHALHCERVGVGTSNRHLAFITYLNTIKKGGTEFPQQDITVEAIEGTTIIFPADWTHSHRGVISELETKYIITGWITYAN